MPKKVKRCFWQMVTAMSLLWICSPGLATEPQASGTKVAVVNGSVINENDFNREVSVFQRQLMSRGNSPSDSQILEMKKNVLEILINRELLYQKSRDKGIKVDEAEVANQLKTLKGQFANEDEFKSVLIKKNFTETMLISEIQRRLAIQQLIEKELVQGVTVSDAETKTYYDANLNAFKQPEQVRASHILIKVNPNADESQKLISRTKIEKVQKKLQEGQDFAALAKEFSEGPSSAKGGDLGYFGRGQMVKPFEEAAFALGTGGVSGIVETSFGYHLIKLIDKKPEGMMPYEEIKDKLKEYLKEEKVSNQINLYVEGLKREAKVERFLK
jgi:peptidyl-prolyl cis-trans isomerase C